jgi:hypothetical protein
MDLLAEHGHRYQRILANEEQCANKSCLTKELTYSSKSRRVLD